MLWELSVDHPVTGRESRVFEFADVAWKSLRHGYCCARAAVGWLPARTSTPSHCSARSRPSPRSGPSSSVPAASCAWASACAGSVSESPPANICEQHWRCSTVQAARLWAERARRELAASGERRRKLEGLDDKLTPQERQIAQLVAEGRTNREVASLVFLSPKRSKHT